MNLLILSAYTHAQNVSYTPIISQTDIINKQIDLSRPLGTIAGNASVTNSGSSNYNIPIATPMGTNGLVPSISINYNSMSGNGIIGYGWNISGLSMISRNTKNMYYNSKVEPVNLDFNDPLNLDGNRLVLLTGIPVIGIHHFYFESSNIFKKCWIQTQSFFILSKKILI